MIANARNTGGGNERISQGQIDSLHRKVANWSRFSPEEQEEICGRALFELVRRMRDSRKPIIVDADHWLLSAASTIGRSLIRSRYRGRERGILESERDAIESWNKPESPAIDPDKTQHLDLNQLCRWRKYNEDRKKAITMHLMHELTVREISEELNRNPSTIKSWIRRSKQELQNETELRRCHEHYTNGGRIVGAEQ